MFEYVPALSETLIGSVLVDGLAHPRRKFFLRSPRTIWLLLCLTLVLFGFFLALSGNSAFAAISTLALHLLAVLASNAKNRMLGEPLLFTDLALVGAMFRHPQFYFSVLTVFQKSIGIAALIAVVLVLGWLIRPSWSMVSAGAMLAGGGLVLTDLSFRLGLYRNLVRQPDLETHARAFGLVPSLLLYWLRWRESLADNRTGAPTSSGAPREESALIVVVQCESYADPVELFDDPAQALPSLEASRADAVQWGNLLVSGFGAYTMRTEYGVLYGLDENALGFRLYDPYMTAIGDAAHALPNKLGKETWHSVFVHPHDMRFYNRARIMPSAGFAELVSEDEFAPPSASEGRYVTDAAVAQKILDHASAIDAPAFIYAVTIENHGPWAPHGDSGSDHMVENYLRMVRAGDDMLRALREGIASLEKPAILVFFGDHRPSIPGASVPGGERHTPYVMIQFDEKGQIIAGENRRADLTPAQLHHALLALNGRGATN